MKNFLQSRSFFLPALILIALSAAGLVLYSTPEGLGLSDDSIAYIAGARSLLSGAGYREAWLASNGSVTHLPPGFPAVLALVGLGGLDPLRGARFINSLLFGANAFLLGLSGWSMTKSRTAGLVLALLFVLNSSLLRVHVAAMSEPLYIFFSLAAFLTFSQYFRAQELSTPRGYAPDGSKARLLDSRSPNLWLIITSCLVGLAYLTRYAGLALLATFLVALIVLQDTWRKRLVSTGIFIASTIPFLIGWSIRNMLVADNATNRKLVYHMFTAENIQTGIRSFSEFLAPIETWRRALVKTPDLFLIVVAALGVTLLVWLVHRGWKKISQPVSASPDILSFTNGVYIFAYLASIVASMLLFDASTKFKVRILSPIYVALLLLLVFFGYRLWQQRAAAWRGLVVIFTLLIFSVSVSDTAGVVMKLHKGGQGYTSFQWYDSEAMAFLRELPAGTRIYTNEPGPVYLYTGRPCYVLPDLIDPVTALPREGYTQGVAELHRDVLSGDAVLALFKFGSESEDVQSVYLQLADGLHLAYESHGDKIFTVYP